MFKPELREKPSADEIRGQLLAAGDYLMGLQRVDAEKRDANWQKDVRSAADFVKGWDPILSALDLGTRSSQSGGPEAGTLELSNPGFQTAGGLVIADKGYLDFAERRVANSTFHEVEIAGTILSREGRTLLDYANSTSSGAENFVPVGSPADHPPVPYQQRLFIRDVLAVQGTNLASVPYIRELNATTYELGASAVAEGNSKPEVAMYFEQDDAPVRKIAAWIPATEEIIDDAPTLRGYIDTRLAYMLALREERDVLNGDGTSPRLKGILQFSGVQTQAYTSTDVAITLGLAIAKVENVGGTANAIAMNPIKYWTMLTTRSSSQFDGGFGGGAPFASPAGGIWGLPVIRTQSLALNTAVVGDWRLGATLFDRMRTRIAVGNQHSTYFVENKVAILAEERVALAVHRPDYFVNATVG